ncbi:MAG: hypothetical protein CFH44_00260 [Proteobacteria bacterium]|nr:MAG: hypothetical protein CFH44_00260 [Pseudomonadota bacterium]|tara:strand:- start:49 stop:288 length:240 start_codon:yes stop_codon:yes gene_type:complete
MDTQTLAVSKLLETFRSGGSVKVVNGKASVVEYGITHTVPAVVFTDAVIRERMMLQMSFGGTADNCTYTKTDTFRGIDL